MAVKSALRILGTVSIVIGIAASWFFIMAGLIWIADYYGTGKPIKELILWIVNFAYAVGILKELFRIAEEKGRHAI